MSEQVQLAQAIAAEIGRCLDGTLGERLQDPFRRRPVDALRYRGELISRMDQIPQRAGRCPFLSGTLNKSTTCVKAENSRGVCTISATSNGHRQDWHRLVKTCYGKSAPGWPRDLPAAQVPRVVLVQNYARIITGGLEVVRRRRAGSTNPAAQLQPKTTMMCTAVGKTAGQGPANECAARDLNPEPAD